MKKHPELPRFEPAEEDIRHCAYILWQEAGCPTDRDLDLWLAAKELVRHRAAVHANGRKKCTAMAKKRGETQPQFA
jgi:hypothetical protein